MHTCALLDGTLKTGDEVMASVDEGRRMAICRNHTATHLLQKALREVLGDHVHQAGSYQDEKITHFDFTHFSAVTPEELEAVERKVNEKVFASLPVTVQNLPIEEAKKMGAMALFWRKIRQCRPCRRRRRLEHRVLRRHPCAEHRADRLLQDPQRVQRGGRYPPYRGNDRFWRAAPAGRAHDVLAHTAAALKANNLKDVAARAEALAAELKETNKQLDVLKAEMAAAKVDGLFENAADVDGVRIISAYLTGTGADALREMVDKVRDKAPNAVTVLVGSDGGKTMMAVGVSANAKARGLKAGVLVKKIAAIAGGNGGGKPDFAMAGIRDVSKIDEALNAVPQIVQEELNH